MNDPWLEPFTLEKKKRNFDGRKRLKFLLGTGLIFREKKKIEEGIVLRWRGPMPRKEEEISTLLWCLFLSFSALL
jgi:hypothetical protein